MLFSRSLLIILHIEVCICGRRAWQPTPLLLSGESHGQRRLVGSERAEHNWSDLAGRQCVYVRPTLPIYCSAGRESACNEGDLGLIPGLERSHEEGNSFQLQYSGPENSMECIVHGVTKSWTWLSDFHFSLWKPEVYFLHMWFYLCFINKFICTIFLKKGSTFKWYKPISGEWGFIASSIDLFWSLILLHFR